MPSGLRTVLEAAAVVIIVVWTAWLGLEDSVAGALERATAKDGRAALAGASEAAEDPALGGERLPHQVEALARRSSVMWSLGIAILLAGRLFALRGSRRGHIAIPLLVPAVALITGLGLLVHWSYQDVLRADVLRAPIFAQGVLLGCLAAAAVMIAPVAPERPSRRFSGVLAGIAVLALAALYFFGQSPGASGARVRLFGIQPIEGVKLIFVVLVATRFGSRFEQLRYHRQRWRGIVQFPRPKEVLPAIAMLGVLFLGLYFVRDFGPSLILILAFLALYYAATRSWIEWALLIACGGIGFALAIGPFASYLPTNVATRVAMMRDPWLNGQPGGDQLAASLWAFAAGGFRGRGLGNAEIGSLPAGHTDLVLAHLAEELGFFGLALYLSALLALVLQACWIGRQNRAPERMLLACGLAALIFAQLVVIFAGSTGLLPLTGIVVPFLSFGRTSMVVFMIVVALLIRLAADGLPVREERALHQLGGGIARVGLFMALLGGLMLIVAVDRCVFQRVDIMTRGTLAIGFDDAVFMRYDPRLRAIAARIRRGPILDRRGLPLAITGADGVRRYPLGAAMGTLIGVLERAVGAPPWALEHVHGAQLRGLGVIREPLGVWVEQRPDLLDRVLFTVPSDLRRPQDLLRARRLQSADGEPRFVRLRRLDLAPLVPMATRRGAARERAIRTRSADIASRTVRLTIDRWLQARAAQALAAVADGQAPAAAAAIVEVDTGAVLARAQWPDVDPGTAGQWVERVRRGDPQFIGSYGPWKDKSGVAGLYQTGSIFKLFTALAWARQGLDTHGRACQLRGETTYDCLERDQQGPMFTLPDWRQPIHDSHWRNDGTLDVTEALAVSCNVFFAQLGLSLGPEPLQALAADGLELDNGRSIVPGKAASRRLAETAFGQGAARMHVLEAARMVAAIGAGGIYRRCPPDLSLEADCEERILVDDPDRLLPILVGMRRVVDDPLGTARRLQAPPSVRLYAKTGTATDAGRVDEVAYGFEIGLEHREHSWLVAIAEPDEGPECAAQTPGRIAFAAVVPRGGAGSGAALDIVQRLIDSAAEGGFLTP